MEPTVGMDGGMHVHGSGMHHDGNMDGMMPGHDMPHGHGGEMDDGSMHGGMHGNGTMEHSIHHMMMMVSVAPSCSQLQAYILNENSFIYAQVHTRDVRSIAVTGNYAGVLH